MYEFNLFNLATSPFEKIKAKFERIERESRLDVKGQRCVRVNDGESIEYDHAKRKGSLELWGRYLILQL